MSGSCAASFARCRGIARTRTRSNRAVCEDRSGRVARASRSRTQRDQLRLLNRMSPSCLAPQCCSVNMMKIHPQTAIGAYVPRLQACARQRDHDPCKRRLSGSWLTFRVSQSSRQLTVRSSQDPTARPLGAAARRWMASCPGPPSKWCSTGRSPHHLLSWRSLRCSC